MDLSRPERCVKKRSRILRSISLTERHHRLAGGDFPLNCFSVVPALLRGINKNTTYRVSASYNDQPGNVRYRQEPDRRHLQHFANPPLKKLKMNAMVSWYGSKNKIISYPSARTGDNSLYHTYIQHPTDPVYTPDGNSYYQVTGYSTTITDGIGHPYQFSGKEQPALRGSECHMDIWKGMV